MEKLFGSKPVQGKVLISLPMKIIYRAQPEDWQVSRTGEGEVTTFQWWDSGVSSSGQSSFNPPYADAFALRRAFFEVRTEEDAQAFLQRSGPFRADHIEVSWKMFRKWQEYLKVQWQHKKGYGSPPERSSPESLKRVIGDPTLRIAEVSLGKTKKQNVLTVECDSVVEAIAAANFYSHRANMKPAECLACGKPFEATTKRARYCGRKCTHRNWRQKRQENSKEIDNG